MKPSQIPLINLVALIASSTRDIFDTNNREELIEIG